MSVVSRKRGKKMKLLIVYTTKGGTTRECAELLAREFKEHDVTVTDMKDVTTLEGYDRIVVGFPIRMARPVKKARKFMKEHERELARANAAYYMCCGFIDCFEEYAEKAIPKTLRGTELTVTCLGGSLDPSRFKGIDKMIVKSVRAEILGGGENGEQRDDMTLPTILDENIAQLADYIKRYK